VRRVNVDLTHGMLRELDARAARLNISRQAVIKTLLERSLKEERAGQTKGKEEGRLTCTRSMERLLVYNLNMYMMEESLSCRE
jgi:metal-responsive CopG/Arc/MetJ family transcriptional regulator